MSVFTIYLSPFKYLVFGPLLFFIIIVLLTTDLVFFLYICHN